MCNLWTLSTSTLPHSTCSDDFSSCTGDSVVLSPTKQRAEQARELAVKLLARLGMRLPSRQSSTLLTGQALHFVQLTARVAAIRVKHLD